jgi:hypothetical protein
MKLSAFSGIKAQPESESPQKPNPTEEPLPLEAPSQPHYRETPNPHSSTPPLSPTQESDTGEEVVSHNQQSAPVVKEKSVTINIKITRAQHEWLTDTARTVRENNLDPVPPGERVYPQHLIGVAINLLQASDVDWSQVKNVEDLKRLLNI